MQRSWVDGASTAKLDDKVGSEKVICPPDSLRSYVF